MTPTPPAEVDVAEGRRLRKSMLERQEAANASGDNPNPDAFFEARDEWHEWLFANAEDLLTAAEQVAGLRETILSAANICEHWADESRNGGWSTHQVEPNRRLAASLRKAALGAAP